MILLEYLLQKQQNKHRLLLIIVLEVSPVPKATSHITFIFLFITALTGIIMRYTLLSTNQSLIPYSFLLHGHSHIALLGWTFLGVFLIFLKLTWHELNAKNQAIWIVVSTLFITSLMFIAFLYQGYAVYSIIFSTLHIGIEYWMVVFIFKRLKEMNNMPTYSRLFIKGALISLVISSVGPFALGGFGMAGMKESPLFEMAIYFFLHFQYNGWLYLMLIGTFLIILHKKNIRFQHRLIQSSFWIYFISLFPAYVLSILWYGLGMTGKILAIFGSAGQFISIILLVTAILQKRKAIQEQFTQHIQMSLLFIFMLLIAKSVMEFGLLHDFFATLIFDTRPVIVGYLHLMLLGFISIFILTQYQITGLLDEQKNTVLYGLAIFIFGFVINELVLFISGLAGWNGWNIPFTNELLFIASILLFIGILLIWSSRFLKVKTDKPS